MPTAIVYRDGKPIRSTTLTADQGAQFVVLAAAVKDAQALMRNKPETDGLALKGGASDANTLHSERHPDDIYSVLPRLAELLGRHPRTDYAHLDQAVNGEVLRNADGSPEYGVKLAHKNTAIPSASLAATALAAQATTLGMLPTDGRKFDYVELVDAAPAGSGVTQIRAHVRWRA